MESFELFVYWRLSSGKWHFANEKGLFMALNQLKLPGMKAPDMPVVDNMRSAPRGAKCARSVTKIFQRHQEDVCPSLQGKKMRLRGGRALKKLPNLTFALLNG